MGIYVQEEVSLRTLKFSGPWEVPIVLDIKVIQHQSIVTLIIPPIMVEQFSPSVAFVDLPSDLLPPNYSHHYISPGVDVGASPVDVNLYFSVIAKIFPTHGLTIGVEGVDLPFSGSGLGGPRAVHLTYSIA